MQADKVSKYVITGDNISDKENQLASLVKFEVKGIPILVSVLVCIVAILFAIHEKYIPAIQIVATGLFFCILSKKK